MHRTSSVQPGQRHSSAHVHTASSLQQEGPVRKLYLCVQCEFRTSIIARFRHVHCMSLAKFNLGNDWAFLTEIKATPPCKMCTLSRSRKRRDEQKQPPRRIHVLMRLQQGTSAHHQGHCERRRLSLQIFDKTLSSFSSSSSTRWPPQHTDRGGLLATDSEFQHPRYRNPSDEVPSRTWMWNYGSSCSNSRPCCPQPLSTHTSPRAFYSRLPPSLHFPRRRPLPSNDRLEWARRLPAPLLSPLPLSLAGPSERARCYHVSPAAR